MTSFRLAFFADKGGGDIDGVEADVKAQSIEAHSPEVGGARDDRAAFPVGKLFPNLITVMSLCIGLTSIRLTFTHRWEMAVVCIIIAGFLDGIDGRLARLLHADSSFGAQLDSLADSLNFGVAPAMLLYFWILEDVKIFGWAAVMLFVTCMVLRLARFNVSVTRTELPWKKNFFYGIPAPASAGLAIVPVILSFKEIEFVERLLSGTNVAIYLFCLSMLTVSTVPTFSLKNTRIKSNYVIIVLAFFGFLVIAAITKPWITMPILAFLYLLSIPFSVFAYFYLAYKNRGD